jgi:gliding motility-associated-like protein
LKQFLKYIFPLCFLVLPLTGFTQGTNCSNSDPFCTGTTYNFPNSTNVPNLGSIDCCATTPNPAWYYLQIDQSGNIDILIEQTTGGGSGIDVDFVMFGPYNTLSQACSNIPGGNVVSCSYSTAAIETATIPNAVTGQIYVLLLTNFSNTPGSIEFSQSGGSGSTDCSIVIPCDITSVTANPTPCNTTSNQYNVSGNISFADPPLTGTMTITNSCGGAPVIYNAPFVSPLPYSFNSLNANGQGCSISVGFSDAQSCTGNGNYTAPAGCVPCDLSIDAVVKDSTSCFGICDGSITITASGSQGPFMYSINNGATTQASPVFNNICAGTYTVWVRDAGGLAGVCTVTQVESVQQPTEVTATETDVDTDCGTCLGTIDVDATGGTGAYQYSIDAGATFQPLDVFSNLCIGTYSVLIIDANNCPASVTGVIDALNGPQINSIAANPTLCPNSCDGEIIINSSNTALYSIDGGITFQPSNTFSNLCAGTYQIVVGDGLGCDDSGVATIVNPPHIPISFYWDPARPTVFNTTVNFYNTTPGNNTYVWTIDTLATSNTPYTTFNFPVEQASYLICLEATDANGCTDEICQILTVYDEPAFFIPNAFTPNGDGKNDIFTLSAIGIDPSTFEILIFNRWGNLIFQSNDINFKWDGTTTKGPVTDPSEIDVYVWRVSGLSYSSQEMYEKRGHVTIVR